MKNNIALISIPSDIKQKSEWIKYALRLNGHSGASIGASLGVTRVSVSHVICGASSENVERAIAKAIGIDPKHIWPLIYDSKNNRIRKKKSLHVNNNMSAKADNVQINKVA